MNYATGQVHDIARLTAAVHEAGAVALWDLAHAAGNVPLALHDADVDGAAWCTYKYLNGGPGAIGQLFVHERHATDAATLRLTGWWGNDPATRFEMAETFEPAAGADGWRISTPPILSLAPIRASLAIFDEVGIEALRRKSVELTAYLEGLVDALVPDAEILTRAIRRPAAPSYPCASRTRHAGWPRWRRRASSPTSASPTSSGWRRSRSTTPSTTPGARRGRSPRRARPSPHAR